MCDGSRCHAHSHARTIPRVSHMHNHVYARNRCIVYDTVNGNDASSWQARALVLARRYADAAPFTSMSTGRRPPPAVVCLRKGLDHFVAGAGSAASHVCDGDMQMRNPASSPAAPRFRVGRASRRRAVRCRLVARRGGHHDTMVSRRVVKSEQTTSHCNRVG